MFLSSSAARKIRVNFPSGTSLRLISINPSLLQSFQSTLSNLNDTADKIEESTNAVLKRAIEIANMIKVHSPSALSKTKKAIWNSKEQGLTASLDYAWNLISEQHQHPDFLEGTASFVEKRPPNWKPYSDN